MPALTTHFAIDELRRLRAAGRSLQRRQLKRYHPRLWSAIEHCFPSYEQALRAAGISPRAVGKPVFVSWDKESIVRRLRALRARGKDLSTGAIQRYEPRLAGAIFRYFGKHDAALAAAGIDPASARKQRWWTRQDVIEEVRRRRRAGEPLSSAHVERHASPLYGAMIRRFGSVAKALRAAGIDPQEVKAPWPLVWPTERIVNEVRQFYDQWWATHPRTEPPRPRLSGANAGLANAARARFGSMGAALKAAGIDDPTYRPPAKWAKERIVAALRKVRRPAGALTFTLVVRSDPRLPGAAARHFGSLRAGAAAAGLAYEIQPSAGRREMRHWTEQVVLKTLKDLHRDGQDLRHRAVRETRQPLFWAAQHYFGTYANAVKAAGVDYWKMSQTHLARQRQAGKHGAGLP